MVSFKEASDKFPTLNHILTLAGVSYQQERDGMYWDLNQTSRTPSLAELIAYGLVEDRVGVLELLGTEKHFYPLTPEGSRVLSQIDPVEVMQTISECIVTPLGTNGYAYFIGKLPLEALPEFLASSSYLFRIVAEERLRELEDGISQES